MDTQHHVAKKIAFTVSKPFRKYLKRYGRELSLPVSYDTLRHFTFSIPVLDSHGKDTLWESVFFNPSLTDEIHASLKRMYSIPKMREASAILM